MSSSIHSLTSILFLLLAVHHHHDLAFASPNPKVHSFCSLLTTSSSPADLALKSISPGFPTKTSGEGELMLFAGNHRYDLQRTALGHHHLRLKDSLSGEADWSSGVLSVAAAEVAEGGLETLSSVYLLTAGTSSWFERVNDFLFGVGSSETTQQLAAVTTDRSEYLFSLQGGEGKLLRRHTPKLHPAYSLILEVENRKEQLVSTGYVIHKDIFAHTDAFILYDFLLPKSFNPKSDQLPIYKIAPSGNEPQDSANFYYIEKTEDPATVNLVARHSNKGSPANSSSALRTVFNPNRQLFSGSSSAPPIGCKLGTQMYLFDASQGCVYILSGLPNGTLAGSETSAARSVIQLSRTSVPFENFFLCDPLFFPKSKKVLSLDANRCSRNVFVGSSNKGSQGGLHQILGIFFSVAFFLVFITAALYTGYYCLQSGKSQKENHKTKKNKGLAFQSGWIPRLLPSSASPSRSKSKVSAGSRVKGQSPTSTSQPTSGKSPATTATSLPVEPDETKMAATTTANTLAKEPETPLPILPPLGNPATAPPEGRAPFQERVKATAQAIALRAPPPPPRAKKIKESLAMPPPPTASMANVKVENVSSSEE